MDKYDNDDITHAADTCATLLCTLIACSCIAIGTYMLAGWPAMIASLGAALLFVEMNKRG